jgi:hypothetical protein
MPLLKLDTIAEHGDGRVAAVDESDAVEEHATEDNSAGDSELSSVESEDDRKPKVQRSCGNSGRATAFVAGRC